LYRLLGFEQVWGYNRLRARGLPEFIAGTFRSTGDPETAALLPRLLPPGQPPRFIFFLTVGAHLPVHLPLPPEYSASCSLSQATRESPTACGWFRIESATLAALAHAAAAPQLPPTVFLIVGDHAPPFVDSTRRFFSPAQVPYVLLTPRPARGDGRVGSAEARSRPRNGVPPRSHSVAGERLQPVVPLGRPQRGRGGADRRKASGAEPPIKTGCACGAGTPAPAGRGKF
jgi:hypothetical protein